MKVSCEHPTSYGNQVQGFQTKLNRLQSDGDRLDSNGDQRAAQFHYPVLSDLANKASKVGQETKFHDKVYNFYSLSQTSALGTNRISDAQLQMIYKRALQVWGLSEPSGAVIQDAIETLTAKIIAGHPELQKLEHMQRSGEAVEYSHKERCSIE